MPLESVKSVSFPTAPFVETGLGIGIEIGIGSANAFLCKIPDESVNFGVISNYAFLCKIPLESIDFGNRVEESLA